MKFIRISSVIDSHTEGEPARVVVGGIPMILGSTIQKKWLLAKQNPDGLRKLLMFEPHGSNVMAGSILILPCHLRL